MDSSELLFEKDCGIIIRLKYPNYPADSWGEDWVNTLKKKWVTLQRLFNVFYYV